MYQKDYQEVTSNHLEAIVGSWYAMFNLDGLNIIKGNKNNYVTIANSQMSGQEITVHLPNKEQPVRLMVESVQNLVIGADVVTYSGFVINEKNSSFTISISEDGVLAQIDINSNSYIISPLRSSQGKHSITLLDKTRIVRDNKADVVDEKAFNLQNTSIVKSVAGSGRVDILFYYASDVYWPSLYVSSIVSK